MNNFKVVVEHDFFSRKPIFITFKVSLVEKHTGSVLHSDTFKHRSFNYGLLRVEAFKDTFLQPKVILGMITRDIGKKLNFEVDKVKSFDQFMFDMYRQSPTEHLKEYQAVTKSEKDIDIIITELKKRGEMDNEKVICTGSIGK